MNHSEEKAIHDYQESHWPPQKVWSFSLQNAGLHLQSEVAYWASLLKNHPSPYGRDSSIWVTHDGCAVYLPKSHYGNSPGAELWTCDSSLHPSVTSSPSEWHLLGSGLAGFEKMINFLDKRPYLKDQSTRAASTPRNIVDPKEIHY